MSVMTANNSFNKTYNIIVYKTQCLNMNQYSIAAHRKNIFLLSLSECVCVCICLKGFKMYESEPTCNFSWRVIKFSFVLIPTRFTKIRLLYDILILNKNIYVLMKCSNNMAM